MMIFKNLFRRKVRSILTIIGIAIGVATIVTLRATADGLTQGFTKLLSKSGAHLVLTQAEGASSAGSITFGVIDEKISQDLLTVPNVDVAGTVFGFTTVPGVPYFALFGYDTKQFAIQQFEIVKGTMLDAGDSAAQQIILGKRAAENLKKGVGDSLKISDNTYQIVGIYETGSTFEDGGAVVSLAEAQAILKQPRQVTAYLLRLENVDELEATRQRLEQRFPKLSISLTFDVFGQIGFMSTVDALILGVSVVAILVGGVVMMNTVIMSVLERTREIGTLRSLGWRKQRVFTLILGESLLLSLLGSLVGIGMGVILTKLVGYLPAVSSLSLVAFTSGLLLNVLLAALGLGIVGGLFPAWWASRLAPLEAMRYEEIGAKSGRRFAWGSMSGLILGNLWRSRARSLFTIIGVSIGLMAVVTVAAITEGFTAVFSALVGEADLVAVQTGISDLELSTIDQQVGTEIAAMPGIQYVSGGISKPIALEGMSMFDLKGRDPDEYDMRHFRVVQGDDLSGEWEILLGIKSAQVLKKQVGETLEILGHTYHIVGIYEAGNPSEEYGGVISLSGAQELFGKAGQVSYLLIKIWDRNEVEEIRRQIQNNYPGLSVSKAADFANSLPEIKLTRGATKAITILTVLVAVLGLMNTMIMSVFERTRQIGVLRAVGWRRKRVLRMILSESLILSLVGGLVGIALGMVMIKLMMLSPEMAAMDVKLNPGLAIQVLLLASVLGMLGGLYPAWWALRLGPVEALRYE